MDIHAPNPLLRRRALIQAAALGAAWPAAWAQEPFPSRPVRIVVPFAAGGPTDLMARAIAKAMNQSTGQPFIVDNKPGGGGVIGMSEIGRNPADGYTMVMPSILAVTNPALMPNYPFDTLKDFSPVTVVGFIPHALVVKPDFPATDLQGLVRMGKQTPGSLSYASSGIGTSAHLAGALFAQRAGIQATHVPYRGAGPAVQDLLGGRVQFMFLDMSSALGQIQAGKLRALAVAPSKRFEGLPQVPTVAEQGYPGFDVHGWYGLLLKSGTPAPVIDTLYKEVKAALAAPDLRAMFKAQGIEPGGMPPAEYGEIIRKDLVQWRKTIAELGIKLD
ncbi:tripartite tricarboxylate transporter substrate binding protein [Pseudacidovorax sp. RU35E]|uniref:Bug family tripartite tricarboxylate transporter substrate binding protein n=1 Tax=Pseudacidovorax sp. RU35E TaxID=1907403 RepID=UPI000955E0CB|nr:tripartite tricarboxylate transporter substrate binding protein [Pseudacidovorax sp. RU35E]SIR49733.1 Tripartite-type tricarboxylate transporter, receptor component TctC [Pseudacidovorax sp. RU35E]